MRKDLMVMLIAGIVVLLLLLAAVVFLGVRKTRSQKSREDAAHRAPRIRRRMQERLRMGGFPSLYYYLACKTAGIEDLTETSPELPRKKARLVMAFLFEDLNVPEPLRESHWEAAASEYHKGKQLFGKLSRRGQEAERTLVETMWESLRPFTYEIETPAPVTDGAQHRAYAALTGTGKRKTMLEDRLAQLDREVSRLSGIPEGERKTAVEAISREQWQLRDALRALNMTVVLDAPSGEELFSRLKITCAEEQIGIWKDTPELHFRVANPAMPHGDGLTVDGALLVRFCREDGTVAEEYPLSLPLFGVRCGETADLLLTGLDRSSGDEVSRLELAPCRLWLMEL